MTAGFSGLVEAELNIVNDRIEKNFKIRAGHLSKFAHIENEPVKRFFLPALVLLTGRIFGAADRRFIQLASSVEMIYLASEIHFAVPDDNDQHLEGADPRDGARLPVLTGDLLYGLYFVELCEGEILQFLKPLSEIIGAMNQGALLKVKQGITRENEKYILKIVERETAFLFQGALKMTGELAGASEVYLETLADFGYNIGMAYGLLERKYGQKIVMPFYEKALTALGKLPEGPAREELKGLIRKLQSGELEVPEKRNGEQSIRSDDLNHESGHKEDYLNSIFSAIAKKYDILNTVLSLNQDKYWRKFTVEQTGVRSGAYALDVCCGTGMMTVELAKKVGISGKVVGIDLNDDMLEIAQKNIKGLPYENIVEYIKGNAMDIPFPDNTFDCVTIGFGLRNMSDPKQTLRELIRVVKPGKPVVCLDFSKPSVPVLKQIYELYFGKWVPFLGKLGVGENSPYGFLHKSWRRYPNQKELLNELARLGLQNATYYELTGGVVSVHVGIKPVDITFPSVAAAKD